MIWLINHFHIQLLIIELILCVSQSRRSFFLLRFIPLALIYAVLPLVVPGGFFFPPLVIGWFTFGFLIMLFLSAGLIAFCFKIGLRQLIFCCCLSHTLQHMGHCISRMCLHSLSVTNSLSINLMHLLVMGLICLLAWRQIRGAFLSRDSAELKNSHLLFFAIGSTAIVYVYSLSNNSTVDEVPFSMLFIDFFSCLLILFILLDTFRLRKAEQDRLIMMRMLAQEQERHKLNQATIEVINRKCHDLKHQIAALRHMNEQEQEKSISDLEKAVLIYDHFPKSGLDTLDTILAEKSMLAEQQQIALDCIIDGGRLDFMSTEDLYSLMGNALDNAIEAVAREPEGVPRIITVHGAVRGDLYSIHIDNPCSDKPLFENGLPRTLKSDKDFHGYGTQSIRYICEKYGGALQTSWEDGFFNLDILLPLKT